jgi:hypothetical protein
MRRLEVDVAVTNIRHQTKGGARKKPVSAPLEALTTAALALPGLMVSPAVAQDNTASFQYEHYQEGERDLFGVQSRFDPIEVDTIRASTQIRLSDRDLLGFNFTQDTWGGATPVATAPLVYGGNRPRTIPTLSGASPLLMPRDQPAYLDANLDPLERDSLTGALRPAPQLVHILSSASPETRKQIDFNLQHEWNEAALDLGGGLSNEDDYESRFANLNLRGDFNRKLTSLSLGLSYADSDIDALLDHDAISYIYETSDGLSTYNDTHDSRILLVGPTRNRRLQGERQDWGAVLGLTQVMTKESLLQANLGFTRTTGYLDNPYKAVTTIFVDPEQTPGPSGELLGDVRALLENRPDERNQWTGSLRYAHYLEGFDAAVHFGYRLFHDDWGITAHTLEAEWVQPLAGGWSITPRVRYYSQSAADFYRPYLVTTQPYSHNAVDAAGREILVDASDPDNGIEYVRDENFNLIDSNGNLVDESTVNAINKTIPFDRDRLPDHYSSDARLSGFGALSGGITLDKEFARGVRLELGAEYYTHQGSLKLGGGGEGSYADFDYFTINGALTVDLSAQALAGGDPVYRGHGGHSQHTASSHHHSQAPAGVMFDHMLDKAGDLMVGYRYMYSGQEGAMRHGASEVPNDQVIVTNACGDNPCYVTPKQMRMHMHMLDLMYAPTDWLTLMLMSQFVDMDMSMRPLEGAPSPPTEGFNGGPISAAVLHAGHSHTTGGVGDTGLYGLFRLFDAPGHHLHIGLGLSAPTGDVGIKLRDTHGQDAGFIHYDMQLGSGTWDFKPSITYTTGRDRWSLGLQLNGTIRLEGENESGYALGNVFQSTAWGSYRLTDWLSASLRGLYTAQGSIRGEYDGTFHQIGPMDYTSNYGGQYWDVGIGLKAAVPRGDLAGNTLGVEWLQPVRDDFNGYQLARDGALTVTWSYAF